MKLADDGSEDGFTLVELLAAMGVFTILLGIFMAVIVQMTTRTVAVESRQMSRDELNRAFSRFDKSLRYASSVNFPGKSSSGNWYFEYLTKATKDSAPAFCTQYKVDATDHTLAYRTWNDGSAGSATDWIVTASRVVNDPAVAADQPFVLIPAGGDYRNQAVNLLIQTKTPAGDVQQLKTQVVAVNTSADSQSNDVSPSNPDVSLNPVCTGISRP